MADTVRGGFIPDTGTVITELLRFADQWSALGAEFATFTARGITITQQNLTDAGYPNITPAEYNTTGTGILQVMQALVDSIHAANTAAKLYRMKK